jgi:hypothetical protein
MVHLGLTVFYLGTVIFGSAITERMEQSWDFLENAHRFQVPKQSLVSVEPKIEGSTRPPDTTRLCGRVCQPACRKLRLQLL